MKPFSGKRLRHTAGLLSLLLSFGCDKFEYTPHQVTVPDENKNLNHHNLVRIASLSKQPEDTIRFLFYSDTQRAYDETEDFVKRANQLPDIDFVINGGDISDFGTVKEFRLIHERVEKLKVPNLMVIGNHDAIGNGKKVFASMYGAYDYSFSVAGHKFVLVNTNILEFDDGSVPHFDFLEEQLKDTASYTNALVIAHTPPFDQTAFNDQTEQRYAQLLSRYRVSASLHGHLHRFQASEPYDDGVKYLLTDNMADRSFLKITPDRQGSDV